MKTCANCTHTLKDEQFAPMAASPDGLHVYCRACLRREPFLNRAMCGGCGANRLLAKFPDMDARRPCTVCKPPVHGADDVSGLLEAARLRAGGPCRTVTDILAGLGVPRPSKATLNAAGLWLRCAGFPVSRTCGRVGYRVVSAGEENAFSRWVETYGALDALQLSAPDRDRYMRGVEPPVVVRLAMSALIAGLPPHT